MKYGGTGVRPDSDPFSLGVTLRNLEEAIWLPHWSQSVGKYQHPVEKNAFVFAVIVITMFGYIYLGFIGMMGLNAIFPHLVATIVLKILSGFDDRPFPQPSLFGNHHFGPGPGWNDPPCPVWSKRFQSA